MKFALVMSLLALVLVSCEKKKHPAAVVPEKIILHGQERADAAAARVRPDLERDLARVGLHLGDPVFIRAFKEEKLLDFFIRNRATGKFDLFRTYPIVAASGGLGPKLAAGDRQVPEGFYVVPPAAMNPDSRFHLAFNIGYPNEFDRAHHRTGSAIMVHGDRKSIGCLAMTDEKIEEIYTLCAAAHAAGRGFFCVHLFPFRMTVERMEIATKSSNFAFWQSLKDGYDLFEKDRIPSQILVVDGRYHFPVANDR
jgi:murein L,D-transpeptidase YafK